MENGVPPPFDKDKIPCDSNDDLEVFGTKHSNYPPPMQQHSEASTSAGGSSYHGLVEGFLAMGYKEYIIYKAIQDNGNDPRCDQLTLMDTILTYTALEKDPEASEFFESFSKDIMVVDKSAPEAPAFIESSSKEIVVFDKSNDYDPGSSGLEDIYEKGLSSDDELEKSLQSLLEFDEEGIDKLSALTEMGYAEFEVNLAIQRCGPEALLAEILDCICAHRIVMEQDEYLPDDLTEMMEPSSSTRNTRKRRMTNEPKIRKKSRVKIEKSGRLPRPMVGFGLPSHSDRVTRRKLPKEAASLPYFYFENVALTPKGSWETMSQCLYGIEPEYVDSKYFCAAARKRGYIHNLPIDNRFQLTPIAPLTILGAFPALREWWPVWDTRTKLNCLQTSIGSAKQHDKTRKDIENCAGYPPLGIQASIIRHCRRWNLVWVGSNKVAPLEPDEVETLLGFPRFHTRGGGITKTNRYKSLGNSFQVDTVAYHLSVLKARFPDGMNVLSLFTGIGGAEVALHRLGIIMKVVVSVEKVESSRNTLSSWWDQTRQRGKLIHYDDVKKLDNTTLKKLIGKHGGFHLVIGGSPCNNFSGNNRVSRNGLEGKDSCLFYEYVRILKEVKAIMASI